MTILAVAATNSRHLINRVLIDHATARLSADIIPGAKIELLDLNDFEMPIYSSDREQEDGISAPAEDLFAQIGAADALLVSFAEHNGFVTAAWKNVFDWMSRIEMKLWQGKPVVVLAATPGPRGGVSVLASLAMLVPHFGADLRGTFGTGKWAEARAVDKARLNRAKDTPTLDDMLTPLKQPSTERDAV